MENKKTPITVFRWKTKNTFVIGGKVITPKENELIHLILKVVFVFHLYNRWKRHNTSRKQMNTPNFKGGVCFPLILKLSTFF